MKKRFTIKEFNEKYKTDDDCLHQIFLNKYSNQKTCSKCGKNFKYYKVRLRKCYTCSYCGNQLHPLSDTIFHKSSTNLKSWFYAIFLFSVSKNGVSSKELQRHIGVTYKCAWRMSKQIRKLLSDDVDNLKLKGLVEIDETYIGGKEGNKHKDKKILGNKGRSTKTKSLVIGAIEKSGRAIAKVIENVKKDTIKSFVENNIEKGTDVKTDKLNSYSPLKDKFNHETRFNINIIEGFWSQLKKAIYGTYHYLGNKYLQSYIDEFCYRYNRRNDTVESIFSSIISRIW